MKKFFFSLAAIAHLFFCLNAHARDVVTPTAESEKEAKTKDQMTRAFLTIIGGGALVMGIEAGGDFVGVPRGDRAAADLTVILAALSYALDSEVCKEIAKRIPFMTISADIASSKPYLHILKEMRFFGESFKEMGDPLLASMSTIAIYNLVLYRVLDHLNKHGLKWDTGTDCNS